VRRVRAVLIWRHQLASDADKHNEILPFHSITSSVASCAYPKLKMADVTARIG
jgi:hypothetical protein